MTAASASAKSASSVTGGAPSIASNTSASASVGASMNASASASASVTPSMDASSVLLQGILQNSHMSEEDASVEDNIAKTKRSSTVDNGGPNDNENEDDDDNTNFEVMWRLTSCELNACRLKEQAASKEVRLLQQQLTALQQQHSEVLEEMEQVKLLIIAQREEEESQREEHEHQHALELEELQEQMQSMLADRMALKEQLAASQRTCEIQRQALAHAKEQVARAELVEDNLDRLQTKHAESQQKHRSKVKHLKQTIKNKQKVFDSNQEVFAERCLAEVEALQMKLQNQEQLCFNLEKDYAHEIVDLEQVVTKGADDYQLLRNETAQEILDLETELEIEIKRNSSLEQHHKKELLKLKSTFDPLLGEVRELQNRLDTQIQHEQKLKLKHNDTVFDLKAKLDKKYSQTAEDVYGLQSQVEQLKDQLESKEQTVDFLRSQMNTKQQEVDSHSLQDCGNSVSVSVAQSLQSHQLLQSQVQSPQGTLKEQTHMAAQQEHLRQSEVEQHQIEMQTQAQIFNKEVAALNRQNEELKERLQLTARNGATAHSKATSKLRSVKSKPASAAPLLLPAQPCQKTRDDPDREEQSSQASHGRSFAGLRLGGLPRRQRTLTATAEQQQQHQATLEQEPSKEHPASKGKHTKKEAHESEPRPPPQAQAQDNENETTLTNKNVVMEEPSVASTTKKKARRGWQPGRGRRSNDNTNIVATQGAVKETKEEVIATNGDFSSLPLTRGLTKTNHSADDAAGICH